MVWTSRDNMLMSSYTAMYYGAGSFGAAAHGDGATDLDFNKIPARGKWHHLTLTFDGMAEKVYVDGVRDTIWPLSLFVKSSTIKLGTSGLSTERYSGFMANAQLFDKALNDDEVVQLMEATRPAKVSEPETTGFSRLGNPDDLTIRYSTGEKKFTLNIDGENSGIVRVRIVDLLGRVVDNKVYPDENSVQVYVSQKGAYILTVLKSSGETTVKKVVAY